MPSRSNNAAQSKQSRKHEEEEARFIFIQVAVYELKQEELVVHCVKQEIIDLNDDK
jgi:hypothetical protein